METKFTKEEQSFIWSFIHAANAGIEEAGEMIQEAKNMRKEVYDAIMYLESVI